MTAGPELPLRQQSFYEDILSYVPSDIVVLDTEGRYLFLNPMAMKDPAVRSWMIGKTDEEYFASRGEDMALARSRTALFVQLLQTKQEVEWEEETINGKGEKEILLRKMFPVPDEAGNTKMIIGYGINITERKRIEEQVVRSEKRYRDLFNYSQALICTHQLDGKIISVNPTILHARDATAHAPSPNWLEVDRENLKARVLQSPKREDLVQIQLNEQLIVELYSK